MISIAQVTHGHEYLQAYVIPPPTPYVSSNETMAGIVRVKSGMWQVNDGCTWQTISSSQVNINLTPDAVQILDWARNKMESEKRAMELAEEFPQVADALQAVREAEEKLKVLTILCE